MTELTYSPIAYWPLEEITGTTAIADAGPNAAYARDVSLMTVGDGYPSGTTAPNFDGTQDYVNLYSASLVALFNGAIGTVNIFTKLPLAAWTDGTNGYFVSLYASSNNYVRIYKSGSANTLAMYYKAGGTFRNIAIEDYYPIGWTMYSITWNKVKDEVKFYIDGLQVGPTLFTLGTWAGNLSATMTLVGAQNTTPVGALIGQAARCSVYNTDLATDQLRAIWGVAITTLGTRLKDMPKGFGQHGFAELNGLLYAVAGDDGPASHSNKTYAYNPVTDTWTEKADYPIACQSLCLHSYNGKLYGIGGFNSGIPAYYGDVYEYDPDLNTWTAKTPMPTPREDMGSAIIGDKIYVFGGLAATILKVKTLEVYDITADTWDETRADLPDYKQLGDFGCALDGMIYAVSGSNSMSNYPTDLHSVGAVYKYNPNTDVWTTVADYPEPSCYKEVVANDGQLWVMGGATLTTDTWRSNTSKIYSYDPGSNTWSLRGYITYPTAGMGLAVYDGDIYMSGGQGMTGSAMINYLSRLDKFVYTTLTVSARSSVATVAARSLDLTVPA